MSKPFPYWLRLSIVSSLSVLLSFNPAFAGRIIHRAACGNGFRAPSVTWVTSDCCGPVIAAAPPCGCDVVASIATDINCGGCVGSVVQPTVAEIISVPECGCGSMMADPTIIPSTMEHAHSSESIVPSVAPEASVSPSHSTPVVPDVAPKPSIESTDAAPPMPRQDAAEPKKEPETTAPKPPAEDLFSPPSPPPTQPKDDLFSPPATTEPEKRPAIPPSDDLFSPMPEPGKPATPPADDLFSTPPAMKSETPAPASDDIFGAPPAANTPAPASTGDDLFGTPPAQNPPSTPAGGADLDNLFKSANASPDIDKAFEASMPVSTDAESDPNFDELFASPGATSKFESPKAKSSDSPRNPALESPKTPNDAGVDNLFKSTSNKFDETAPASESAFRGAEFREWVDNTGDYSIKARLVVIYPDRVRLVKENGKFTSVPTSRLSNTDRNYVNWVAVSLSKGPAAKFVNTETSPSNNLREMAR